MGSKIIGCGSYLPEKEVTNKDLTSILDTTEEWIESRTGILKRYIAAEDELTSHIAFKAAERAIAAARIDKDTIDLIIVATTTPDNTFPATATKLQSLLNLKKCPSFDVQAVCSGFIYGLHLANSLIKTKAAKTLLLVGAEKMSSVLDWSDRSTAILFGDGAGAIIITEDDRGNSDIIDSHIFSSGEHFDLLFTDGGVALNGLAGKIRMKGREVFRHAVEKMSDAVFSLLAKHNISLSEVDHFIPHQANIRIIEALAERLNFPHEKIVKTVSFHANCSAASIPLALDYAHSQGLIKRGDLIMTSAIGAGLTWGAALIRY
ncbi:MAG: 3-oxoacyl-(acyl carrier protein) synthase [Rickettsiaceae bacterium]|jgi:3-oxoacyl-[acyl-carrier-protein] synthase-3|nr:3-oxoacyl-(acyl carrier protein) synthase [Rickettsiaceae bacterium]